MERFPAEQPSNEGEQKKRGLLSMFIAGAAIIAGTSMAPESALGDEPKPEKPKEAAAEEVSKISERLQSTAWYEGLDAQNLLDSKVSNIKKLTLTKTFTDWWAKKRPEEAKVVLEERKASEAPPLGLKAASALFNSMTNEDAFIKKDVSEQEANRVIERAIEQASGMEKVLVRVLTERKNWVSGVGFDVTDWKTFDPSKTKLEGVLLSEQFARFLIKRNGAEGIKAMLNMKNTYVPFPSFVQEFGQHLVDTKEKSAGAPRRIVELTQQEAEAHRARMLAATK